MFNPQNRKRFWLALPEVHITSKTRRGVPALRLPAEGTDKAPAKPFGKREQERAARRMEK